MTHDLTQLTDLEILQLCVWREARGEETEGQRGVAHVIANRVYGRTRWWGTDWRSVILHPWQFSSFNPGDPNADLFPLGSECFLVANAVYNGTDLDLTLGANMYYDKSIAFPHAWGSPDLYENTFNVGRLRFFRLKISIPLQSSHETVNSAPTGE